jgi:hypothetical protein
LRVLEKRMLRGISRPMREKEKKPEESCTMRSFAIFRPVHSKILLGQLIEVEWDG